MVAGPLSANRLTGGLFDGAAPNAQLIDVRQSYETLNLVATLARPDVDVEFFNAKLEKSELIGEGVHDTAFLTKTLPANLSQWRVAVSSDSPSNEAVEAFLLDCSGREGCSVVEQKPITAGGTTLIVHSPKQGDWRILIRARDLENRPSHYRVREALLVATEPEPQSGDGKHVSGATWLVSTPPMHSDAQYAAFRVVGTRDENDDLRIAMTALTADAP